MLVYFPLFYESRCILCPANTVFPDRVLTPEDLDVAFEIQYSKTRYVSSKAPVWRRTCHLEGEPQVVSIVPAEPARFLVCSRQDSFSMAPRIIFPFQWFQII